MFCLQSDPFTLSNLTGPYHSRLCDPYYMEYTQPNQKMILQMMANMNINKIWLYINRVDLNGWKWFSGETYGIRSLLVCVCVFILQDTSGELKQSYFL